MKKEGRKYDSYESESFETTNTDSYSVATVGL